MIESMSGCELAKHLEEIGVENIQMFTDCDQLLDQYSDETLLDHIINRRDCDIGKFVTELVLSLVSTEHNAVVLPEIEALLKHVDSL